jgi:hypothetical protein
MSTLGIGMPTLYAHLGPRNAYLPTLGLGMPIQYAYPGYMPIAHPWAQLYQYAHPGPRCDCVATLGLTDAVMPTLA